MAVEAAGDKRGSIPDQNFRHIGLFFAFIQLELFRTPFFGGGAKFGSDGIGIDKLLCMTALDHKTALDQQKCERRSTAETERISSSSAPMVAGKWVQFETSSSNLKRRM